MIPVNERIEEIRIQKGLTKSYVAREIGITPMGYHYLATGHRSITTDRLQLIAKALDVDPRDFFCQKLNERFRKGDDNKSRTPA